MNQLYLYYIKLNYKITKCESKNVIDHFTIHSLIIYYAFDKRLFWFLFSIKLFFYFILLIFISMNNLNSLHLLERGRF
jgi:hypothetical protein